MLRFQSMISQLHEMKDNLIEFPIDRKLYNLALAYASEQSQLENGLKVFYNTMAVWAVNHLLGWFEIETILGNHDDWTVGIEATLDLADLMLPGIGKIQCCRIYEGDKKIFVQAQADRIVYIFVEFPDPLETLKPLGFFPAPATHSDTLDISVDELQSFDRLEDYLKQFEEKSCD